MNDKEAIINKILQEANATAEQIIDDANKERDQIISNAKQAAMEYRNEKFSQPTAYVNDLVSKGKIVSDLEARKILLNKKKSLIDDVFNLAIVEIKSKTNIKKYTELVASMIEKYAEDGDVVCFSKTDSELFDKAFLDTIAKKNKIKLTLSKEYGSFNGGVILSNDNCDKNLTLEVELKALRKEIEPEIAAMIFGND